MDHLINLVLLLISLVTLAGISSAHSAPGGPAARDDEGEQEEQKPADLIFEDRSELDLDAYRGKVLVLELAAVGCRHSDEIYKALLTLREEYDERVEFVRLDHGQSVRRTRSYYRRNPPRIHVIGDPSRSIGKRLPSQAYPTLYLFGKWGRMRYMGGFDPAAVRSMVNRLAIEKKVNKKNFFLKKVLDRGDVLPNFTLPVLDGKPISTDRHRAGAKAFVLIFAGTGCPISRTAVSKLGTLARQDDYAGLKILTVNLGRKAEAVQGVYESMNLPFPVLVDAEETLVKPFGVASVPTVFVAGETGKIQLRSLWHFEAVKQEVDILLGKVKPEKRQKFTQQGSG